MPAPSAPTRPAPPRRWRRLLLAAGLLAASPRRALSAGAGSAAGDGAADRLPLALNGDPDCGDGDGSRPSSRYRALVCWLWKAAISLPDEEVRESLFTLRVTDLTCTHFRVAGLASAPAASGSGADIDDPALELSARGISARCGGSYDVSFMSGTISAVVGGGGDGTPSLRLRAGVSAAPLGDAGDGDGAAAAGVPFPSRATLSSCRPDFVVSDVAFAGSASAHVIGLFSNTIAAKVTSAMNDHVCALLQKNGEAWLDGGLDAAREHVGRWGAASPAENAAAGPPPGPAAPLGVAPPALQERAAPPPPPEKEEAVGWDRHMPFLKRLLLGLDDFLDEHLDEGIILTSLRKLGTWQQSLSAADCEDCGFFFRGVNGLVSSLTKGTGVAEFPVPASFLGFRHNHTFRIPEYGDITLTAHSAKISGIDRLTDLTLFRPEGQNLLTSSLSSRDGFQFSLLLNLQVTPAGESTFRSDTLNETFRLHVNASDLSLHSTSALALDYEVFRRLTVGGFLYGSYKVFDNDRSLLNCVVEALESVVVRSLEGRMTLDALRVAPAFPAAADSAASLEDDADALLNDAVQLLLSAYPAAATAAVAGILRAPAREALNAGLAQLVDNTKKQPLHCVNVKMPEDKGERPLRLDGNKALQLFDDVVNGDDNVAVANAFLGCVDRIATAHQLLAGHLYTFSVGEMDVVLHDLQIENANSVTELQLLKPEDDHYHLASELGYGTCAAAADAAEGCTTTSLSFGMNLVHSAQGNLGNINVHVKMKNWKLEGGTGIKLDLNYLPHLQISDLLAHPQCLTIPLTNFAFYGLNSTVEMLEVNIDVDLNGGDDPRSFTYRTGDATELARGVSTLMTHGSVLLQEALDAHVARHFREARNVCETPVNPHQAQSATRYTGRAGVWTFLVVMAFVVGNAWLFLRGFKEEDQGALLSADENAEGQTEEREEPG